jgi:Fe-S-cluster-containing dehydrogenase component/formate-dependent nitrite reductase membrane component NrfD
MLQAALAVPPVQRWAKVIDHTRCIGCHACSTACKSENGVPLSVHRTYVKYVEVGSFPQARRAFQVTRCNQCEDAPCTIACPTAAMYRRSDGIVDFDKRACIGCKACIAACPYDAIFINPEDHSAEKCNFCAHRLDVGLEPACVVVCPTDALLVGDLADAGSRLAEEVQRGVVTVRRPEKHTGPKVFYKGAHQATLDPLAATRPPGGLFMWSEQGAGPQLVVSGHPGQGNAAVPALLAYDVPHRAPWDWRVSLYTWTKGIAAGAYLVPMLLLATGSLDASSALWQWIGPLLAVLFLGVTGLVLIADLEHPARIHLIVTRPQWRSWLVRGALLIAGFSAVLAAHLAGWWFGRPGLVSAAAAAGLPLAVMTAVYTAYLFAQARARDLWQSPLLPPQLLVQAAVAGSAALVPVATWRMPQTVTPLLDVLAVSALVHLLLVAAEATQAHPTAHAQLAVREMTRGRYAPAFLFGVVLMLPVLSAPWIGAAVVPLALVGLLAHEHAHVQAAQSVPLA